MTMERHALLSAQAADVKTVVAALKTPAAVTRFADVQTCQATSLSAVIERFLHFSRLPAALVVVGPGEYPDSFPNGPSQRNRVMDIGVIVVGEYSADPDADADTVWDLVDAVDRAFMPTAAAPTTPIIINGVIYRPKKVEPIPAGDQRSAYMIVLEADDAVSSRSDV